MSFSFGSTTTTAGSTFGTTTPSTGGFPFGGGDSKPLFGGSVTETKPAAFNFTSPQATNAGPPAFGGFSFAGATSKTTAATTSLFAPPSTTTGGSAFGASKPLSFAGFSSPPNQTVGSPGFGQPVTQNAPQNMSFAGTIQQQPPGFGTPTTQATSAAPTFGPPVGTSFFGQPAATTASTRFFSTPPSGFSAAQPSVTATTSSAPQTTQSGFALGSTTTTTNLGSTVTPGFGQSSFKPAFGFGGTGTSPAGFGATTTTSAPAPSFASPTMPNFQLGAQQPTSTPATQTGLNLTPATTSLSFSQPTPAYGTPTGLGFGTTQAQTGLNIPATSTALSFGTPTTQTGLGLATPASTALNFSRGSLDLKKPAAINFGPPASVAATSTGHSFGTPATTGVSTGLGFGTTTAGQTSTGISFAPPSTAATSTGLNFPTSTPQTTTGLSSGLGFGTTTSTGLGFGISTAAGGLPFAKPATSTVISSAAASTAPSGIVALGKPTATTTMAALTTVTTTAAGPPPPFTSINFAQLEENINKFTLELEDQEKTFINQATQINAWDRLLIANGEKIVELNDAVQTVKNEQQSLEHELDFVLAQQKELEDLLVPLEKQLLENAGDRMRDPEREHMYSLAENLDTQLRQMSEDLKEVIEHLNETNRSQDSNDPIVQIGRILNAHMSSMQWVDNSIAQISTKLDQLKATHDTLRRDNERSFQLTYN